VRPRAVLLAGLAFLAGAPTAGAIEVARYAFDPGGRVKAVRAADWNGDGRPDLGILLEPREGRVPEVLLLVTPPTPVAGTYFEPATSVRIRCDGDLAECGAVALGRFGPAGEARLRFFGPRRIVEVDARGRPTDGGERLATPTLLARSEGRPLVLWDGVADLDRDGLDETWYPAAEGDGRMRVLGGVAAKDRALDLVPTNQGSTSAHALVLRTTYVPNLFPADLDGDGTRELVAYDDGALVGWSLAAPGGDGMALAPTFRLALPFEGAAANLAPEEMRTPRIQIADADGDGKADLLVTLITGRRDQLGSIRTTLLHYPGPFRDAATGRLVAPRARIDTESAALHPKFVDLDGDGALDYVCDSIRGTRLDLFRRILGEDPAISFVGFRFDRAKGTFDGSPYFSVERTYSSAEAMGNTFGPSAWFDGDFDRDGHRDMLDLGALRGFEVLGASKAASRGGAPVSFAKPLVERVAVERGLTAGALVLDLDGDRRSDVVLWNDERLLVVLPRGGA
jgi:hypothetical protein